MFSDTARKLELVRSTLMVCEMTTWNRLMSLGLPAFFKQFWLHFKKNFRKNLKLENKVIGGGFKGLK
jgi:hypothetical protein